MGFLVRGILRHEVHIGGIAVLIGSGSLACTGMFQIEAIDPTPFPGVVQIKHRHHLSLPHFHQQIVGSSQDRIVIDPRTYLQRRLHLGGHAALTVATHKDSQVVDAHPFHQVQFLNQTLAIASLTFRTQDSTIPEVGAYVIIGLTIFQEMTIANGHELRLSDHRQTHRCQQKYEK